MVSLRIEKRLNGIKVERAMKIDIGSNVTHTQWINRGHLHHNTPPPPHQQHYYRHDEPWRDKSVETPFNKQIITTHTPALDQSIMVAR